MKTNQANLDKDPAKQSKTFEELPAKTKELELMKDQAEKSTGKERVETNKKIGGAAPQPDNGKRS